MRAHNHQTAQIGELIAAAFDTAATYSTDPREVSRLATQAVGHMLRHARKILILAVGANNMRPGCAKASAVC